MSKVTNSTHMGFEHQLRKEMACLELPPTTNAGGHEMVLTITQMHSNLNPKQHTSTKNHQWTKNTIIICYASSLGSDATSHVLQHIASVDSLAAMATWLSQQTQNTTLKTFTPLWAHTPLFTTTYERGVGNESPLGFRWGFSSFP